MKTTTVILAALCAFVCVFTGCSSTSSTASPSVSPEQGAAAERVLVSTGATLALSNNPKYLPAAEALVAGIDAAVASQVEITPERIAQFVKDICVTHDVAPKDVPIFINLATSVYQAYSVAFKTQVVSSVDPKALLYITAFKDGLRDAIVAVKAAG